MEEREDQERVLVFSGAAIEDIKSIWLYTYEKWGLDYAERYESFIYEQVELLVSFPLLGRPIENLGESRALLIRFRSSGYGHIAVYSVQEEHILVSRIFHTSENWS